MAVIVLYDGNTYTLPTVGDLGWGQQVTAFFQNLGVNSVTTDTAQTIIGSKTFTGTNSFTGTFLTGSIKDQSPGGTQSLIIDGNGNLFLSKNLTIASTGVLTATTIDVTNLNVQNFAATYFQESVATTLTATGTTQGGALLLGSSYNEVVTITGNSGVILPQVAIGTNISVNNLHATNSLNVYPPSGGQIDTLGSNAAYSLPPGKTGTWKITTTVTWRTLNPVANYS